jgi:hypothetical protein
MYIFTERLPVDNKLIAKLYSMHEVVMLRNYSRGVSVCSEYTSLMQKSYDFIFGDRLILILVLHQPPS